MTTENLLLFQAVGSKMDYLNQRQRILAQNVANADTPGYRPYDLQDVKFGDVLQKITGDSGIALVRPVQVSGANPNVNKFKSEKQDETYEVSLSGNAVIMEEQLIKAGETVMDYNLMSNIYQKHVGMIRTSLGAGR